MWDYVHNLSQLTSSPQILVLRGGFQDYCVKSTPPYSTCFIIIKQMASDEVSQQEEKKPEP